VILQAREDETAGTGFRKARNNDLVTGNGRLEGIEEKKKCLKKGPQHR